VAARRPVRGLIWLGHARRTGGAPDTHVLTDQCTLSQSMGGGGLDYAHQSTTLESRIYVGQGINEALENLAETILKDKLSPWKI
jgi:hypothetical protein